MSSKIHILLLIAYVFAPFLHSEGSTSVHPTLSNICKKTRNADLCISTIAPGFNGREVDASSAVKEAIRVTTTKFEEAEKFADKLAHEATTPRGMVDALKVCNNYFALARTPLQNSLGEIENPSDPEHGLDDLLGPVVTFTDFCIAALHERNSTEKSPLDPVASELSNLIGICSEILTQLAKSKDVAGTCKAKGTTAHVDPTLSKICKKIIHKELCVTTIAPLLKGGKADVVSALRAEIQAATSKCKEATQLGNKLVKDGTTPSELVKAMNVCNKKLHSALKELQATEKAIDSGDREVSDKIGVIEHYVRNCQYSLSKINAKDSPFSIVVSDLSKLTDNCDSLTIMMGDPEFAAPASAAAAQVHPTLSNICKKTSNADLCISTIAPGFNGREADATSALKEAIVVITPKFQEAEKFADKLAQEATTPRGMVDALNVCGNEFALARSPLQNTLGSIGDTIDPDAFKSIIGAVVRCADSCIAALHEQSSTEKSPLDPVASQLSNLINICSEIGEQIHV